MPPKLQLPEYQDYYRYLGNEEPNPDTGFRVRAFIRATVCSRRTAPRAAGVLKAAGKLDYPERLAT